MEDFFNAGFITAGNIASRRSVHHFDQIPAFLFITNLFLLTGHNP